jgi:choline-sulfatase
VKHAYDRGVEVFDRELGIFLDGFENHPTFEDSAMIVTSDHGEALFERDFGSHGNSLFDEETAIPFAARLPPISGGKVVDCTVGLVDVMPTLCTYLGIECPKPVFGRSLVALEGARPVERTGRYTVSEGVMNRPRLRSIRNRNFKLIWEAESENSEKPLFRFLVDLRADPNEQKNLVSRAYREDNMKHARRILVRAVSGAVPEYAVSAPETTPLTPEEVSRLKQLGYIED